MNTIICQNAHQAALDWSIIEMSIIQGLQGEILNLFSSVMHNLIIGSPVHPPIPRLLRVRREKI